MKKWRRLTYGALLSFTVGGIAFATCMPGRSHRQGVPPPDPALLELSARLETHVRVLSEQIGERRIGHRDSLERAREYLLGVLQEFAPPGAVSQESIGPAGDHAMNLILELPGATDRAGEAAERASEGVPARATPAEIVVVGAHYDTAPGTTGANDNASGVAATLELARRFVGVHRPEPGRSEPGRSVTLRFVLFANEEPPYFQNPGMGSLFHAEAAARRGDDIVAMLALESLGYYSSEPGSQRYPGPISIFYPSQGDFVAFVGNPSSRGLVRQAIGRFRETTPFPSEGAVLPGAIPGVGWSDHWSFWQQGYPAIMVTDTAVFRDPHYHEPDDDAENLDFVSMARVTRGLERVIDDLVGRGVRSVQR